MSSSASSPDAVVAAFLLFVAALGALAAAAAGAAALRTLRVPSGTSLDDLALQTLRALADVRATALAAGGAFVVGGALLAAATWQLNHESGGYLFLLGNLLIVVPPIALVPATMAARRSIRAAALVATYELRFPPGLRSFAAAVDSIAASEPAHLPAVSRYAARRARALGARDR